MKVFYEAVYDAQVGHKYSSIETFPCVMKLTCCFLCFLLKCFYGMAGALRIKHGKDGMIGSQCNCN